MQPLYEKQQLKNDFNELVARAHDMGYIFSSMDAFALGYMAAKYGLTSLLRNVEAVVKAVEQYDQTDDLALLDTIGETLIDLDVIPGAEKESGS